MTTTAPLPDYTVVGFVAHQYGKQKLPLQVCKSAAGYYIGTLQNGMPFSRESDGYYPSESDAATALRCRTWDQKPGP